MNATSRHVIDRIASLGGAASARLLEGLASEFLRDRGESEPYGNFPPGAELDAAVAGLDRWRANPPGGQSFNVIPSPASPHGTCCPLVVGVALGGFSSRTSTYRPNFPHLTVLLAAHALKCHGIHRETLVLTPEWNQRAFEERLVPYFDALKDTGRPAFVVEIARTGLFLRWPW